MSEQQGFGGSGVATSANLPTLKTTYCGCRAKPQSYGISTVYLGDIGISLYFHCTIASPFLQNIRPLGPPVCPT